MTDDETRYRNLVEEAYSAPSAEDGYQDVLAQTHRYLFRDEAKLHADLPRSGGRDIALEMHLPQLKALFESKNIALPAAETNYAVLTVHGKNGRAHANPAAQKLFGGAFPTRLEELSFDRASLQRLQKIIRQPEEDLEVLLVHIGQETPQSCLATIRREASDLFEICISFLDWTPELLTRAGLALGLSEKERDVFAGIAHNLTLAEIADQSDRSIETVRSQSKNILRKTGCSRMSEVVQIAAGLAYLLDEENDIGSDGAATQVWETPKSEMQTLQRAGGRTLAYYTRGHGRQRVLFLHGFLQGPFFTPQLEQMLTDADIKLICPSRPGFGYTSASRTRSEYERTALDDAIALLDRLDISQTVLACHQLSTNHAFRLKAHVPDRIRAMVMVSASPPIDDAYLDQMDTPTRIAAAAARYTPSILKLINEIGIHSHRRKGGPLGFLKTRYKGSPLDLEALDDPVLCRPQIDGVFHYIEQGSETLVREAASSMANWGELFVGDDCPQCWIHGAECQALKVDAVRQIVQTRVQARYDIIPGTSTNLLHQRPDLVVSAITKYL
ncbi:MAG: alpha/beta fold hydrolase [Pseudomonadota bacterium]